MGLLLRQATDGTTPPQEYPLPETGECFLVYNEITRLKSLAVVQHEVGEVNKLLAKITVAPYGLKLEAIELALGIIPGCACSANARSEEYVLPPTTKEHTEIILLRPGDIITSPKLARSLTCVWNDSEVQVNSSATELVGNAGKLNGTTDVLQGHGSETAGLSQNDVTVSATQTKSQQFRATPRLSNQHSVVVQETPTAARMSTPTSFTHAAETEDNQGNPFDTTQSPSAVDDPEANEDFSTARNGKSPNRAIESRDEEIQDSIIQRDSDFVPDSGASSSSGASVHNADKSNDTIYPQTNGQRVEVRIPRTYSRKRHVPAAEEADDSEIRSSKRAKASTVSSDDTQDSRLSNIIVDTSRKSTSRSTKGQSEVHEAPDDTPSTSQRSSQRSSQRLSKISADVYGGPIPHVAFSNSAILPNSQAIKFLKKQKGSMFDSVSRKCNVLCVRPGVLVKTMKLLESLALGIHIVTDAWLLDSAKAGNFLALNEYIPQVQEQEKDWNFELEKIWGQPQSPFENYAFYFTADLQKSYNKFEEIKQVCKAAGAKLVSKKVWMEPNVILLAKDQKDQEVENFAKEGAACYNKDIIAYSILRGELDLDSNEFMILGGSEDNRASANTPKAQKKSSRKSH